LELVRVFAMFRRLDSFVLSIDLCRQADPIFGSETLRFLRDVSDDDAEMANIKLTFFMSAAECRFTSGHHVPCIIIQRWQAAIIVTSGLRTL
jgi:hypothetical protein